MLKIKNIKKLIIIALTLSCFISISAIEKRSLIEELFRMPNSMSNSRFRSNKYDKFLHKKKVIDSKYKVAEEIEQLQNDLLKTTDKNKRKALKRKCKEKKKEIALYNKELNSNEIGNIFLLGIAGKNNWEMVADQTVESISEGLTKGAALRGAVSLGDAIGGSVDGYLKVFVSGLLGQIEKIIKNTYRAIFHSGCKPFGVEEIQAWDKLITNDLREIEIMVRQAEKYSSRSRQEIFRKFDENKENILEENNNIINLWKDFSIDFAITCHQIAEELDNRKNYYQKQKNGFGVISCINRIINKLKNCSRWILSTESLQEFAEIPEAKLIIPTTRKSFENYFTTLINQIKPINAPKTPKTSLGRRNNTNKNYQNRMYDNI